MSKKLLFSILLIFTFGKEIKAQGLQDQVERINAYIEQNSDGNRNYYAKINATQENVYFYNGPQHITELTFAVNKIDADNIKITKKGLTFRANEKGNFVIKQFAKSKKNIATAWLNVINMNKKSKIELKNLMRKFILDYQKAMSR